MDIFQYDSASEDKVELTPDICQWNEIDWKKVTLNVRGLQRRIAQATEKKDKRKIKRLQKLLLRSFSSKLLAIRKVTTNKGKNTPGIDGETWNAPSIKWEKAFELNIEKYKNCLPLRRILIPKKDKREKRPLSIPCKKDLAMQALCQLALDPVSETLADKFSFGFRRDRSCQDATSRHFILLARKGCGEYIFDADIKKCFDKIAHQKIQELMDEYFAYPKVIDKFIKADHIFQNKKFPNSQGVAQGGIISPTIANMVLDGFEEYLKERRAKDRIIKKSKMLLTRYCDDFTIVTNSQENAQRAKQYCCDFLKERGLELSEEKSKIVHINEGFDFLGFNLRKYGDKLLIKPNKKSILKILKKIRETIAKSKSLNQETLIKVLNPIIKGWCEYYSAVCSKRIFQKIDYNIFKSLYKWCLRKHPNKSKKWVNARYFHAQRNRKWIFAVKNRDKTTKEKYPFRIKLYHASSTPIVRHPMIKCDYNPYLSKFDAYRSKRLMMKWERKRSNWLRQIIKRQDACCHLCSLPIHPESYYELDHIIPSSLGGLNTLSNLRILCYTCHKQRHNYSSISFSHSLLSDHHPDC